MAKQTLAVGSNANDGTGDTLRAAMIKVNDMFTEVYNSPGIAADTISISGNGKIIFPPLFKYFFSF